MKRYLVTGGSGFFGSILVKHLAELGHRCVNLDLCKAEFTHAGVENLEGDLRDEAFVDRIFREHGPFDAVFHLAAMLAHAVSDEKMLWESNVKGTEVLARACIRHGTRNLVFTSSNCLWGAPFDRPVTEDEPPAPIEIYGKSKAEAERILLSLEGELHSAILRTPTIIAAGRLGLLAILFEFINEDRRVWVVGKGANRYQFVHAEDLVRACLLASEVKTTRVYNVGSDAVKPLREIYEYVIRQAGSKSKVRSLPGAPTILGMKLAHRLGISPLGPYHYKMIQANFQFDTSRIKTELGWKPTRTNEQMLHEAYDYYHKNRQEILSRTDASAHRSQTRMGIIRVLKWIS